MTLQSSPDGHRQRLRERFIKSGLSGFADYEVVELLLSLGTPRRDTKPQAKEAIKRFKTLRGVLSASIEELQEIEGIGPNSALCITLVREVAAEYLKAKVVEGKSYQSSQEVYDYLYGSMRDLKKEVFKVIYLNSQNQILDTADLFKGTIDTSPVSLREVMEQAIVHNAASLIFAHNHPSGNCQPSQSDKDITRDLVFAGSMMQVNVLDHIIIGNNKYFSFAGEGLISQYETDYLSLKIKDSNRRNQPE